jgi:hypothetical protein
MPEGYEDYLVREDILKKKNKEREDAEKNIDPFK